MYISTPKLLMLYAIPSLSTLSRLLWQVLDVRNNSSLQLAEDLRQALPTMEVLADS